MTDRGQFTEITIEEGKATGSMPEGTIGRACLIAEHASVLGINLVDAATDIQDLFGDCELATELSDAQANAGTSYYCIVATFASGYITGDTIKSILQGILDMQYEPEFFVLQKPCDLALAQKYEEALQYFQDNKRWFSGVAQYRRARAFDLEGVVAADGSGHTILPIVGHGFLNPDQVVISGSGNYDGTINVLPTSTADALHIDVAFTAETFPAGALLEEKPETYATRFGSDFATLSADKLMLVAPVTQLGHLGAVFGYGCKQSIEQSIGRRDEGGIKSVEVDPAYSVAVLRTLVSHGAVILKRPVEKPNMIVVNDDTTMWTAGSVRNWSRRRILCKGARSIFYYGNDLVNSNKYPKTKAGAMAAGEEIATGLKEMRDGFPAQISGYELAPTWGTDGKLLVDWVVYDLNRLKIIGNQITLEEAQSA
ncbi:hypothetical protein KJ966_24590 [bacterium]|nr:hypothetical protein [bacterium]